MARTKIGDMICIHKDVNGDSWTGQIIGITDLFGSGGGRMVTVQGPDNVIALVNED